MTVDSAWCVATLGLGYCVPDQIRNNDDPVFAYLNSHKVPNSDIFAGLKHRRVLAKPEDVIDIMVQAASQALSDAGKLPADVDLLLGTASVGQYIAPNDLAAVHAGLKLGSQCRIIPLNTEYTNFHDGMKLAHDLASVGTAKCALVVCGCNWTHHVDYHESVALAASDGAGAAVVGWTTDAARFRLVDWDNETRTDWFGAFRMAPRPASTGEVFTTALMKLDDQRGGSAVKNFGLPEPGIVVHRLLQRNKLRAQDVTLIAHQTSKLVSDTWAKEIAPGQYIGSLEDFGDMVMASVPVNWAKFNADIQMDHLVLLGIGMEMRVTALLYRRDREAAKVTAPAFASTASTAQAPAVTKGESVRWNLNVAQLLLEYLKLEGVTKVFGIPGGASIYLMQELRKQSDKFDFIVCRHETGAAYIADGYSRVTGGLGVVLTTSGPAATNALTGTMNAQASNSSVLTITGEVPRKYFGMGYLQEGADAKLDVDVIYRNAVQSSAMIADQSDFQTLFQQALRDARSLPPRASHISLPNDVAGACVLGGGAPDAKGNRIAFPPSSQSYRAVPSGTDLEKVERTLDDLLAARRPLIFLGNGCRSALASPARLRALQRFADRFGIPVMTTPDAKGIYPESDALSLRNYGMTACAWPALYMRPENDAPYDTLLVLGSALGELSTTFLAKDQYSKTLVPSDVFIQVDLDQSVIGRGFLVTRGIVAEVGATIDALCAATRYTNQVAVDERKQFISAIKQNNSPFADPAGRASEGAPVHPAAMARVINELVQDGHVFIDAGNCVGWSLNNMVIDPPVRYHIALAMGPMGFGVAAVVGAKLGDPGKPCVAIVGDAALMMHGAEVSTAAQHRIGAIWVVLFDNDLGMVSQGMERLFPPESDWDHYYKIGQPNLVKFSEGLGARAVGIAMSDGVAVFRKALKDALRHAEETAQPQVIVVSISTEPMPPYGWPRLPAVDCSKAQ